MQESKRAEKQLQKNVISPSEVRLQLAELQHRQDINKTPKLPAATKKAKHVFPLAHGQFISMLASVKNSRNNCLVSSSQFSKSCSPTCEMMVMHSTTLAESLRLQTGRVISHHKQVSGSHLERKIDFKEYSGYILISPVFICLPASLHDVNCSEEAETNDPCEAVTQAPQSSHSCAIRSAGRTAPSPFPATMAPDIWRHRRCI